MPGAQGPRGQGVYPGMGYGVRGLQFASRSIITRRSQSSLLWARSSRHLKPSRMALYLRLNECGHDPINACIALSYRLSICNSLLRLSAYLPIQKFPATVSISQLAPPHSSILSLRRPAPPQNNPILSARPGFRVHLISSHTVHPEPFTLFCGCRVLRWVGDSLLFLS